MSKPQSRHDRIAYLACTSIALGVIVVMWAWNVRAVVGQGVQGTKQMLSDVSNTAGSVRRETAPDPATVADIKEKLKGIVTKQPADATVPETTNSDPSTSSGSAADDSTMDALAQLMKNDVETYGEEPKN